VADEHQSTPEREVFLEFAGDARLMAAEIVKHRAEIDRLRHALRIIAGEVTPPDYLLGNPDVARIALHGK
jgi:hypothetical protein